jgi:two-component system response regulator AtoC
MTTQSEHCGELVAEGAAKPTLGPEIQRVYGMARRAASSMISVLILGETGVGKDFLARSIHQWSPRAKGPFLAINCSALPATLVDAELFGHEKGAFTGADSARPGLLEQANGGTVFLDELGDLPLATQPKLLRVIEDRIVTPIGRGKPRAIDVRFIAATNRDIRRVIREGTFRDDLFFRLASLILKVPPLRQRRGEIVGLARLALAEAAAASRVQGGPVLTLGALAFLERQDWPGNIRELKSLVGRALLLSERTELTEQCMRAAVECGSLPEPEDSPPSAPLADLETERARIAAVLRSCAGNQTKAATVLGIARRTLIARIERYGLPRPQKVIPALS